jgi:hypothetical protein
LGSPARGGARSQLDRQRHVVLRRAVQRGRVQGRPPDLRRLHHGRPAEAGPCPHPGRGAL